MPPVMATFSIHAAIPKTERHVAYVTTIFQVVYEWHSLGHFLHSRIRPVENGWCERVLLYGSRKSVGSSVLRAFFASDAYFTRDEPSPERVGGVGLSRKPPKYVRRVALSREPPQLQQA